MLNSQTPWASGPGEILQHGLELLQNDSDTNRRLAIISIDNAIELMIAIYLSLPKRVTGLHIPRKRFQEISESFPSLLDAIEEHAQDKLDGIDLGVIEWYHRLRNQLYHQGNGLTVARDKVEIYAEIANVLYKNLFGVELVGRRSRKSELVGEFMAAWVRVERGLRCVTSNITGTSPPRQLDVIRFLDQGGILEHRGAQELRHLWSIRNTVVHGGDGWEEQLTPDVVERVKHFAKLLDEEADG